ncbi:C45 family autoproteolytic acyltransferase/hydrolase [Sulfitobacter sp. F26169L]|uniref:C45 family autoproteolytic acyltransferase/hydolase n=1 Tax=Sulfitobacter sp. F26169L TaxID=2996015 RepID=UPI002260CA5E|nr:C45 family peptidase [Sulfitobacter sp. F26169L]MCX7567709.1 C45 family autoproteolytic acyltransferase/hydrolase [Sulfitobacter sp. F26169L]
MTFDAVKEAKPGPKWKGRWNRSWPAYEAWFIANGGDKGPTTVQCRDALKRYMPELVSLYDRLVLISGGSDRAARFLSTWCPPCYLGGCSLAAVADKDEVRLVRNYDLSPELNEGLLLHSSWTGRPVMGMVEFLWGLSDGINDAGLSVALAYGGRSETAEGFGITTILRYVLETCDTVAQAIAAFGRVPSHMAYNLVLADASGRTASLELSPGGGVKIMPNAIATNHQSGPKPAERPSFTRSFERLEYLDGLRATPAELNKAFLRAPLIQDRYSHGFGTLFTAEYDPNRRTLGLTIKGERWDQSLHGFEEGQRTVNYADNGPTLPGEIQETVPDWSAAAMIDWQRLASDYAKGAGRPVVEYLPSSTEVKDVA